MTAGLPLLIFLHLVVVNRWLWPDAAVWINASSAVVAGTMLTGPVAAGFAAWAGTRERRRRTGYLTRGTALSPIRPPAVELAAILAVVVVGYVVTTVVVFVKIGPAATWGGPNWLWLLGGLGSNVAMAVSGYAVARVLPRFWIPPVVALSWYLADAWGIYHDSTATSYLFPAIMQRVSLFRPVNSVLISGELMWYVGLALLFIGLAIVIRRVGGRPTRLAVVTVAVVIAALGSVVVTSQNGHMLKASEPVAYACTQTEPIVCVHPAFRRGLAKLAPLFLALHARVAGTPADFTKVVQLDRDGELAPAGAGRFALDSLSDADLHQALADYLDSIGIGGPGCVTLSPTGSGTATYVSLESVGNLNLVRAWLVDDTSQFAIGGPAQQSMLRRFALLTEEQRRAWFKQYYHQIATCTLPADAFGLS
jgi:hypothetical protein